MSKNYLDTVTMFLRCTCNIIPTFKIQWTWNGKDKNSNLHNYFIKTNYCFVRYFPNMYGTRSLFVTFSLPKLYHQCNNNTFNVDDYDNKTFMEILLRELDEVMDVSILPIQLSAWNPSRIDLFRTRTINPADRKEYLYGFSRRSYRGNGAVNYKNTNYLVANNNTKCPNIVERDYNKTIEVQDKKSMMYGNLPAQVEQDHEWLMSEFDIPNDQFRTEFSLRRYAVKRYMKKYNKPVNMETVMDESFQKMVLNELVISRGLNYNILSKKEFLRVSKVIFKTAKTQTNALKVAESCKCYSINVHLMEYKNVHYLAV